MDLISRSSRCRNLPDSGAALWTAALACLRVLDEPAARPEIGPSGVIGWAGAGLLTVIGRADPQGRS